jgi:hypothetical protein
MVWYRYQAPFRSLHRKRNRNFTRKKYQKETKKFLERGRFMCHGIFLDFGGVTTPSRLEAEGQLFNPINVDALNILLDSTDAKIIVTSTHRLALEPCELEELMSDHGIRAHGRVAGKTPWIDEMNRDVEILAWMVMHGRKENITAVIVIDDREDIVGRLWRRLHKTDPATGLTAEEAKIILERIH